MKSATPAVMAGKVFYCPTCDTWRMARRHDAPTGLYECDHCREAVEGPLTMLDAVRELYEGIPPVPCIPGCTDCCGPVPFTLTEWALIPVPMQRHRAKGTLDCPYSLNRGCDIYASRPLLCRLFGATLDPMLQCPHGRRAEHPLTTEASNHLVDRYLHLLENDARARGLHPKMPRDLFP